MEATCRLPKLWQPAVDILTRFDDYLQDNAEDEDDVDNKAEEEDDCKQEKAEDEVDKMTRWQDDKMTRLPPL